MQIRVLEFGDDEEEALWLHAGSQFFKHRHWVRQVFEDLNTYGTSSNPRPCLWSLAIALQAAPSDIQDVTRLLDFRHRHGTMEQNGYPQ